MMHESAVITGDFQHKVGQRRVGWGRGGGLAGCIVVRRFSS